MRLYRLVLYFVFIFVVPLSFAAPEPIGWFGVPPTAAAAGPLIGDPAPYFKVLSGEREPLTLDGIRGKVAVLFYETKDTKEINRGLKKRLNDFFRGQPLSVKKEIVRAGIINCRGVLFRGAWEQELRHNSLKEGITVYGDWDGKVSGDYGFAEDESNFIIIDKKGIVRYRQRGRVNDNDAAGIVDLIKGLLREG